MDVRGIRQAHGTTQKQLADLIGVTQGAVWQWEHGICSPSLKNVMRIAKELRCSIDELLQERTEDAKPKRAKKPAFTSQLRDAEMEKEQLEYQFKQYQLDGNERLADAAYGKLKEAESKVNRLKAEKK